MNSSPDPRLVELYRRARVCQTFPAYRLDELRGMPATEILQAMELLGIAQEVAQSG